MRFLRQLQLKFGRKVPLFADTGLNIAHLNAALATAVNCLGDDGIDEAALIVKLSVTTRLCRFL